MVHIINQSLQSEIISMNQHKTQAATPPYLKYSLISFQQYCNRDFFSQHALLTNTHTKLYTNARNRRKVTLTNQNPSFQIKEMTKKSQRGTQSPIFKNDKLKQRLVRENRAQILNITPAVIHSTTSSRMSFILSQRTKSEVKQVKINKVFRCKTEDFNLNSEGNSFSLKETSHSYNKKNVSRPRTASHNLSALNKIKVYLPSPPQTSKLKDQSINPWDFYQDQAL